MFFFFFFFVFFWGGGGGWGVRGGAGFVFVFIAWKEVFYVKLED